MEPIYKLLNDEIDVLGPAAIELAVKIHKAAELAFHEYKSSGYLVDVLEKHGFVVQKGIGSLDTAFKAVRKGTGSGPTVAFLAEYDALPGIGHGCGHNLIGATSAYAAIALSQVLGQFNGNIAVIGTPAEETGGGKILLIEQGAFDGVDFSIMAHPSSVNEVGRKSRAITGIHMEYFGKSAHSSAPEFGINALKAVINTFNGVDLISQTFPVGVNTNGIITDGGKADNIIPDYARCQFTIRAETMSDVQLVLEKFKEIIKATEILTGATSKVEIEQIYAQRHPSFEMEHRFKMHMEQLGEKVELANPNGKYGSSDIGNVSLLMPIIHTYFKIMEEPVNSHSKEFAVKAVEQRAFEGMLKACKALAMLGADLICDKGFRASVDNEFKTRTDK